ncbi:hypothetical protein PS15p_200111 [Mucor circinelloides]
MSSSKQQTQSVQDQADKVQLSQVLETQQTKVNAMKSDKNASQADIDAAVETLEEVKRELNKLENGRGGVSQLKDINTHPLIYVERAFHTKSDLKVCTVYAAISHFILKASHSLLWGIFSVTDL